MFRREKSFDILSMITEELYLKPDEVSEFYKVILLTSRRKKDHKELYLKARKFICVTDF